MKNAATPGALHDHRHRRGISDTLAANIELKFPIIDRIRPAAGTEAPKERGRRPRKIPAATIKAAALYGSAAPYARQDASGRDIAVAAGPSA